MHKNLFDLSGKTALITGGNSGIGLGFAEGVAKHGADVCIWGTNASKNELAVEALKAYGTKVHSIQCDVSDEAAVEKAFAETLHAFGRVDACFANAGVGGGGPFSELSHASWRQVLDVNLDGLFFTLRCAAKHMKERAESGDKGGRLIGTASLGALMGMSRGEAYGGSKGAVISIMQGLAVEFARYGVTANSILPGHIHTAMTEKTYANEKFHNAIMPRIPARRWGDKSDFEGIAVYLMSDASAYHTADKFLIDGGFFVF
ncbi:MAG: SDR family oxidoreductase [Candidatus Obscuribacterales bacterium]|nr:SDR family oxidoreductase [Steroidobacteraceae bacterium]